MRKGLVTLLVAACGIAAGIALSMKPWHMYARQRKATDTLKLEMKQVETQHIADLQKEAEISSSIGREQLAREQGFHRVGEVPADK